MVRDESQPAVCVVLVTCASVEEAETIANTVISERLAACVNVLPNTHGMWSFYQWEGSLQKEAEVLLILKTTVAVLECLETRVLELHSYEVPEFLALPVFYGSASYVEWVRQGVTA